MLSSKVVILTGGEATGKTSILNLLRSSSSNTRSENLMHGRLKHLV
jgi:dephospho-CoA kinase